MSSEQKLVDISSAKYKKNIPYFQQTETNSEHTQSSEADGSESGSGSEVENESDPWEPFIEEAKKRNVQERV